MYIYIYIYICMYIYIYVYIHVCIYVRTGRLHRALAFCHVVAEYIEREREHDRESTLLNIYGERERASDRESTGRPRRGISIVVAGSCCADCRL